MRKNVWAWSCATDMATVKKSQNVALKYPGPQGHWQSTSDMIETKAKTNYSWRVMGVMQVGEKNRKGQYSEAWKVSASHHTQAKIQEAQKTPMDVCKF